MSISDFTGMRKVTIKNTATDSTGTFVVLGANKVGSDGFSLALEANELTESSYAGDSTSSVGTNVGVATLSLIPKSIADLRSVWPSGYNIITDSWQPPIGSCSLSDVTLVFEKVCDTKANIILRHASVALAFELALSRDDSFTLEVMVYPSLSPGSEYGLAAPMATQLFPYQIFNGLYDPTADTINYDSVP